jgi:hypothetical protein
MEQEAEIIESDNYQSKDVFSYREIVLKQLNRVVLNMSQEMREGFWVHKTNNMGSSERIKYIGDSRKELKNSIDCLHDLLLPKFDEEIKDKSLELYDKIEKLPKEDDKKTMWKSILKIYRNLFQELCLFLERLGWLESGTTED